MFSLASLATYRGKLQEVLVHADGTTRTRPFTKDASDYYLKFATDRALGSGLPRRVAARERSSQRASVSRTMPATGLPSAHPDRNALTTHDADIQRFGSHRLLGGSK